MGSAASYHLSKLGASVVGFDTYHPPHPHGSTHGDTRITRLAIGEGSEYVPLVKRSHELWPQLEAEVSKEIFTQCGGLVLANQGNPFLVQTKDSAEQYGIPVEFVDGAEVRSRYPMFATPDDVEGVLEPSAGYVRPEVAVESHLKMAQKQGAELHFGERVISWEAARDGFQVSSKVGSYAARKLIICTGSWVSDLFPEGADLFRVYRQLLYWFPIQEGYEALQEMPVFIWEFGATPDDFIYGFPAIDGSSGGVKVATEVYDQADEPDDLQRPASSQEAREMFESYIAPNLPWLGERPLRTASCWYTNTQDHRFVIDAHPGHDGVLIVSPCSGHGFKHSAAIGEAAAQWAGAGRSDVDLSPFALPHR